MGKFTPKPGFNGKTVDGFVVSSNHNGAILRNKSIPKNTLTPKNSVIRNRFASITSVWSTLTEIQKDGWETYPVGDVVGFELFVERNLNRAIYGFPPRLEVPEPIADTVYNVSVEVTEVGAINVDFEIISGGANSVVVVEGANAIKAGQSIVNENSYKVVFIDTEASTQVYSIAEQYTAVFGTFSDRIGDQLPLRLTVYRRARGQRGTTTEVLAFIP